MFKFEKNSKPKIREAAMLVMTENITNILIVLYTLFHDFFSVQTQIF